MTDTNPPTNPGDVIVTGERVRAASPFGVIFPGGGVIELLPQTDEKAPGDGAGGLGPSEEEIQCAMPEGRRQWNSDAKAKEAIAKFLAKADTQHKEPDW